MKTAVILVLLGGVATVALGAYFALENREPLVAGAVDVVLETTGAPEPVADVDKEPVEMAIVSEPAPFGWPMEGAQTRVTKKPFGLKIEPDHSPVDNDRFSGYHVGVDFETFADEQDVEVPVYTICDGPLVVKQFAKGYGGMMVQACTLEGQPVAIIYGHLDLASITAEANDHLARGQTVGHLAQGFSPETDGVRKHLHLGVYAGDTLDIRGYVQEEPQTQAWLNPLDYMWD